MFGGMFLLVLVVVKKVPGWSANNVMDCNGQCSAMFFYHNLVNAYAV
jgi:hypothetical protein